MATALGSIINRSVRKDCEPYNILSYVTHERFSSNMARINGNFWMLQGGQNFGLKGRWKECYASVPTNHILLEPTENPFEIIPPHVNFSCIISGHKFGQWQGSQQLSQILQIGIVQIEHTEPTSDELKRNIPNFKQMRGDINIFISEYNANAWGWGPGDDYQVIHHGIDTNLFKPLPNIKKKKQVLTVGNDMINRSFILGFDLFDQSIIKNNIPFKIIGDTKGISEPAQNVFDLIRNYNESSIYINCSRMSPIPMSALEALSCGLPVIALKTGMFPEIIIDDYNGYLVDDIRQIKDYSEKLLNNPDKCAELGKNARQTIIKKFPLDKFISSWNNVLERASQIVK
jgi:hypothetical protein